MEHPNARIEPAGKQGYRHFGFENGVEVVDNRIPWRCCSRRFSAQQRGSRTEREPKIDTTRTPATICSESLGIVAGEPYGHSLPKVPIHPCCLCLDRQCPHSVNFAGYCFSEAIDRRARVSKAEKLRDCGLPAKFDPENFAGDRC